MSDESDHAIEQAELAAWDAAKRWQDEQSDTIEALTSQALAEHERIRDLEEALGEIARKKKMDATTAVSMRAAELPALPDDDSDFTPELARKIIAKYQTIILNLRPTQVTDAMCWAAIEADQIDRIQGFSYHTEYVIRDIFIPHTAQVIWRIPKNAPDAEALFRKQCSIERYRKVLLAALALSSHQLGSENG